MYYFLSPFQLNFISLSQLSSPLWPILELFTYRPAVKSNSTALIIFLEIGQYLMNKMSPTRWSQLQKRRPECSPAAEGWSPAASWSWPGGRCLAAWVASAGGCWAPRAASCWKRSRAGVGSWRGAPRFLWPTPAPAAWSSRYRPSRRGRCRNPARSGSWRSGRGNTGYGLDWQSQRKIVKSTREVLG